MKQCDNAFANMQPASISKKDWPPVAHPRVVNEVLDALNGLENHTPEWKVIQRDKKGCAILWSCCFEEEVMEGKALTTFIISNYKATTKDSNLWELCKVCTGAVDDIDMLIEQGWNKFLGVKFCTKKTDGQCKYFSVFAFNKKEKHDMARIYTQTKDRNISVLPLKKAFVELDKGRNK